MTKHMIWKIFLYYRISPVRPVRPERHPASAIMTKLAFTHTLKSFWESQIQTNLNNGEVSAYSAHHFPVCTRHFLKNCGSIGKNDEALRFLNDLTEDRRLIIGCLIFLKKMKCRMPDTLDGFLLFGQIWGCNNDHSYRTLRYLYYRNSPLTLPITSQRLHRFTTLPATYSWLLISPTIMGDDPIIPAISWFTRAR